MKRVASGFWRPRATGLCDELQTNAYHASTKPRLSRDNYVPYVLYPPVSLFVYDVHSDVERQIGIADRNKGQRSNDGRAPIRLDLERREFADDVSTSACRHIQPH